MPQQNHDYVDFFQYDSETDKMEKVCRVYLTNGKLFWEGKQAKEVKKLVESTDELKPYVERGGYSLLAILSQFFKAGYFYATNVKEPFSDEVQKP